MADNQQSQAPEPGAGDDGFGSAFAERAENPAGEPPKETEGAGAQAPAEGGQSATADAPAPAKAAADEGSGEAPAFNPFAGLSPEQEAHFRKLEASERSNRGRVGGLTKKLRSIEGGTQQPPAATEQTNAASGDEGAGAAKAGDGEGKSASDIEARLAAATDEYGDIIGPVVDLVKELRSEITTLKASPTRSEQPTDPNDADLSAAYEALADKHSDYEAIARSPDFAKWLEDQPQNVIGLAGSYDPHEVSLALTLYKAESAAAAQASGGAGEGSDGSTATGDRRKRQMEGLGQVTNRGAPAAAGTPNDFGSAFKQRASSPA